MSVDLDLRMVPAPDEPQPGSPAEVEVSLDRVWDGTDAAYLLTVDGQTVQVSAKTVARMNVATSALAETHEEFVHTQQEKQHSPAEYGLEPNSGSRFGPVPTPGKGSACTVWRAPDVTGPTAPHVVFQPRKDATGIHGQWLLIQPCYSAAAEPVGTAAWNDPHALADLCRFATDPDAVWMLFALTQPNCAEAHQRVAEERRLRAEQDAEELRRKRAVLLAWNRLLADANLTADTVRRYLRTAHLGDSQSAVDPQLHLTSVPLLPAVFAEDPSLVDRYGLAGRWSTEDMTRYQQPGSADYPVGAWRLDLIPAGKTYPNYKAPTTDPLLRAVQTFVAANGLGTVVERDGRLYWTRSEQILDILLALQAASKTWRSRTIHIPKRVQNRR